MRFPTTAIADLLVPPTRLDVELAAAAASTSAEVQTKRWTALAVGSLILAGLLSLLVVLGRLPLLSSWIADPLFFKRCLVVHVNLSLLVWFYAFLAALTSLAHSREAPGSTASAAFRRLVGGGSFFLSIFGVVAMLAGALARDAQPVLANYVPVINHPLFLAGLVAFLGGITLNLAQSLAASSVPGGTAMRAGGLWSDAAIGLQAASVAVLLAAATAVSALAGLPRGLDTHTYFEFLAWGPGHVLQVANAAAMLAVWLWLLARATGRPVLSPRASRWLFAALIAPHLAMPLLTARGTLNDLYHSGATQLMRWGIFPIVLLVLGLALRHLWRERLINDPRSRALIAGFAASAGLTVLGIVLGACIRSSTTLVPAHYHASLGGVTAAFMTAAYLVCDAVGPGEGLTTRLWRSARVQLVLFGTGQTVFALGFALGGAFGLGRKAYASEQHVRSAGELAGLGVMGIGGLVAAAAGVFFLVLVLREMRGWSWRSAFFATARNPRLPLS